LRSWRTFPGQGAATSSANACDEKKQRAMLLAAKVVGELGDVFAVCF
jgi:hypothetical protein